MSDETVFLIVNLKVTDAETYLQYEKGFFPILKRHGGEFLAYDDESITLEGEETLTGRVVIFKFPNETAAKSWYKDPDYQELSKYRRAGTQLRFLTMVHSPPSRA